jgi:flagellin-like protein
MIKRRVKKKRGLSPVVATVLLISMVVVLGLIIFLWLRGLVAEEATKFDKNVKLVCEDVEFSASYETGVLTIENGNIPLYDLNIQYGSSGNYDSLSLRDSYSESWGSGLSEGGIFSEIVTEISSSGEIVITPVLLGNLEEGKRIYQCDPEKNGVTLRV